jgi:6-phosphogluconolactonase (cycloisomerase 2 family)
MVNPARNLVYAVDNGSFQVSEYTYSPATGALTALSPAAASTGASPLSGGITSDGNWVFVPNNGGSSLSAYGVGTAGQLTVGTTVTLLGQPSVALVR